MNKVLFALITIIIFLTGCSTSETIEGFNIEKIKELINDPNVQIASSNFSAEQIREKLAELNPKCDNKLSVKPYSAIYVTSEKIDLTLYVDSEINEIVCTIKNEKPTVECITDEECADGLTSTVDKCEGIPRVCTNERIQECVSGDSYCPRGCTKEIDSDCTRECLEDLDCDDANILTSDSCTGLVKVCLNVPIIVGGKALKLCEENIDCFEEDNPCEVGICSEKKTCSYSNQINGTECGVKLECFDGTCMSFTINKIRITNFKIRALSEVSVEFTWKTNKLGVSKVNYGFDITYQQSEIDNTKIIDHKIILKNLKKNKKYFYKVESEDHAGFSIAAHEPFNNFFFTCNSCEEGQTCNILNGGCS